MASASSAKPKVNPIPDGYHSVTPYLTVADADRLMQFVKDAYGAQELFAHRGPDGAIAHAEAKIGDSIVMMGRPRGDSKLMPAMIYLYVPDTDLVYRAALGAGGKTLQEPADEFYGDRRAAVEDPCGNQWYMATHVEDVSPEEIGRRAAALAQKS
jgi:PhnB protein